MKLYTIDKRRKDKTMDYSAEIEKCIHDLRTAQGMDDTERAHEIADKALQDFLSAIGYADIAYEYDLVDKWYS